MSKYFTLHLLEIEQLQGKIETEKKEYLCSTMSSNALWRRISYFTFTFQRFDGQKSDNLQDNMLFAGQMGQTTCQPSI